MAWLMMAIGSVVALVGGEGERERGDQHWSELRSSVGNDSPKSTTDHEQ